MAAVEVGHAPPASGATVPAVAPVAEVADEAPVTPVADDLANIPALGAVVRAGAGWYPLVALSAIAATAELHPILLLVLAPEIGRALGTGTATVVFAIVLYQAAAAAALLPFAAASGRRRRHRLIGTAACCGATALLCAGLVPTVPVLLQMAVAAGVASAAIRSLHEPLLFDSYAPDGRVRAVTWHRAAALTGAGLAAGAAASVAFGVPWPLLFAGLGVAALLAALVAVRLVDPGCGGLDPAFAGDTDDVSSLGAFEVVRRVLMITTLRRALAPLAVLGMLLLPTQAFVVAWLEQRWRLDLPQRALLLGAVLVLAVPILTVFAEDGEGSADRRSLVHRAGTVLGVSAALLGAGALLPFRLPALILLGLGLALSAVALPAVSVGVLTVVPPRMRSHAAAMIGIFVTGVGGAAGLAFLSTLGSRFGTDVALAALALPAVVAARGLRRIAPTVTTEMERRVEEIAERRDLRDAHAQGRDVPLLRCRHVDFSYGQLQVLFDVDFTVAPGECVALLGTNGAGKSTLLRVISGLGLPSRGSVHFAGEDITYLDAERRLGRGINQIPGGKAIFGPLSVVENLRVYGHALGRDRTGVNRGIDATLAAFPRLDERRNQLASTLSGGEQQMLALGKALILQPQLLLIDELSLGLAPKIVGELLEMVRTINAEGTAVVLVEQSVNVALSVARHAYFMEKGQIRFDGPSDQLLERRELLRSVFLEGAAKGLDGGGDA